MRQIFHIILVAACFSLLAACQKDSPGYPGLKKVSYKETDELFANPERGFYTGIQISSETDSPLSVSKLTAARTQNRTLYMCEFWLKDFFSSDISDAYLQVIRTCLEAYRKGGAKCILRFGYSDNIKDLSHPDESGPFDTSEDQILRHISQLKPILQEYADIIYVVQAGFIGCWGEWYYTSEFVRNPSKPEDFLPRKHVVDALLDALPVTRQVALRTPMFKRNMYGYSLADTLTRTEAHQPTTKARLGSHNDCFLANSSDQGTFNSPADRTYWGAETRYTIMGGESCDKDSRYCNCENSIKNLSDHHYSYLNQNYFPAVINYWYSNHCLDEIQRRMGYRLSLKEGWYTSNPTAGGALRAVLKIYNDGFASVMNPRDAEFVLTAKDGTVVKTYTLVSDPRFWMPGTTTTIDQTVNLPDGLSGEYTLSLNLPDPEETLHTNPLFSIRLANKDIWDETTGYNKLYTFKL